MSVSVRQDTVLNGRNTTTGQNRDSDQTTASHHYEDIGLERGSTNPWVVNPPPRPSQTSSSSEPSSSEGSESSGQMLITKSGPDQETECEKLEKSTQRIKTVVVVLLVVCTIVIIVYLIVIVSLITRLSKKTEPVSAARPQTPIHGARVDELVPDASSVGGGSFVSLLDRENCVHEDRVEEFKRIWGPEDKQDIMDLLKRSGFLYHSLSRVYCFTSLQWVPEIMGKINSRVQDSVSYIENQQEKINRTVSLYISSNKEETNCSTENKEPIDPTDPLHSVYAHFFMDTDVNYTLITKGRENVRWILEGQSQSTKQGVDILSKGGQFIIRQAGFYFVYSHLVFKEGDPRGKLHRVVNTRDGQHIILLETFQGSASLLQGVFRLRTDDRLSVEASTETLDTTRDKMSYFGAYLIRT